jgi:5'-methylthioadenosine phosphorylase
MEEGARRLGIEAINGGCYVCLDGPRFETPAEIRMFAKLGGDIAGMTGVPEAVLAREAQLCYASIAMVTNWAAGISTTALTHQEVVDIMQANGERLRAVIMAAIDNLPARRGCACAEAGVDMPWLADYREGGPRWQP